MGDLKHKKAPAEEKWELNTKTFRDEAAAALARNASLNALAGRRRGDPGYLLETHADIAHALKLKNQRPIDKLLGGVREGTKIKLTAKSKYIGQIRRLLGLVRTEIAVPSARAEILLRIADLPDSEFAPYRESIERRARS